MAENTCLNMNYPVKKQLFPEERRGAHNNSCQMSYRIRIQILWWLLLTSQPFPQIWVFLGNQTVLELECIQISKKMRDEILNNYSSPPLAMALPLS
jgi:hypothetical protein